MKVTALFMLLSPALSGQLPVARDTISVFENNRVLKMPWAGGINFSNASSIDLNFDGKKDFVLFDRANESGMGRFRCFINNGAPGQLDYTAAPGLAYYFPQASNWAVLLDYNNDGKEDLFCSTTGGIKVYTNTSTNVLSFTLLKSLVYTKYSSGGVYTNLYASGAGVPGIADIDGDGDLDVLTFSPLGVYVEYHRNYSIEKYGNADSLDYMLEDYCWGDISESDCKISIHQDCGFKVAWDSLSQAAAIAMKHAGSCLTCFDADGDGDKDLLMGDVACNRAHFALNGGSAATGTITDTTSNYPNYFAQGNTTRIQMNNFPCSYYLDVDGDGRKDLVASPNALASENTNSVWLYKNNGANGIADFQFVKNNFLQDEMIEVGQNSFPVLIDYDADNKKDLLVGTFGYYQNSSLSARLTLYRNVGTLSQPVFSLVTRDYCNLSASGLNNAVPAVGDVDGDGDIDICIGTSAGQVHWLENTAGAGNPCNFAAIKLNPFAFTAASAAAAPQLFDLDKDGKCDLLVGGKNGRIAFYRNSGAMGAPVFNLVTNFLGDVDVKGDVNIFGNEGYAVPWCYEENGAIKLLVGSVNGKIFYYEVPSAAAHFNMVSNGANGLIEGMQASVCYEDINNDGKRDLFVGNASGGLSFFSSASPYVGIEENRVREDVFLFPNPANDKLQVAFTLPGFINGSLVINDLAGKELMRASLQSNHELINIASLDRGVYLVTIVLKSNNSYARTFTKKLIRN
jgi:hypothetical protein